ncbi:MAG: ornithine carbamoyltransferase [Cardiobacteriaceae bacterium]|nr:ornithine carbamoyltransferase [Cardiobacteriaceae bacterium]
MNYWYQRSLLRIADHPASAIHTLIELATLLKSAKKSGQEHAYLRGKNIVLIFEKTSSRTRCAFEVACFDQGANPTFISSKDSQIGDKESIADTARLFSRLYDAIEYRGFAHAKVQELERFATVPVYNGLTDEFHPTQMLADMLTMQEHTGKALCDISFAYLGDARFNMGNSLLLTGALLGMDVRIAAPKALQPSEAILSEAKRLAAQSGAKILITEDAQMAVQGVDFVHTDIWVSMGEAKEVWEERIKLLMPYRITPELMKHAHPAAKFMHCLPSYHDRNTPTGEQFYQQYGLEGIEVDNAVFEQHAEVVFDQAENRMHTIKALLVATLCPTLPSQDSVCN